MFSEQPNNSNRSKRDSFEQKEREKVSKAPEMDSKEDVSFQDNYTGIRVLLFGVCVVFSGYFIHTKMQNLQRLNKLKQQGLIDYNDESKLSEEEKKIRIGGYWALKDLEGKDFSSYKLEGSYYLLFFGFSLCPDVCPLSILKMTKAINKIRTSNEGKFFRLKPVFVTVNPDYDTPQKLDQFKQMFDEHLIVLRAESTQSPQLMEMLRKFKVPVGLSPDEVVKVNEFFSEKHEKKGFFSRIFSKKENLDSDMGYMNDHSRVFYLIGPENQFLSFYNLDIETNELSASIMDDMSYDLGTRYVGTGHKPPVKLGQQ